MFTNKRFPIKDQFIFPSITLLALFIYVLSSLYIRFQVTLNDFWGVLYYARHISLDKPASLYNGFFPIGYPFLLNIFPDPNVIYFAFAINIISAATFVGLVSILFFQLKKSGWGLIAVFCMAVFYPLFFRYANTTSADISTAAFSMGGIYFLWRSDLEKSEHAHPIQSDLLCGLFFGLSAIFRNHAIISTAAILLAYSSVFGFRRIWARKSILISPIGNEFRLRQKLRTTTSPGCRYASAQQ